MNACVFLGFAGSHLEDVGFLIGQVLLQLRDELVEGFLDALLFVAALIFGKISFLLLFFDFVDGVAADVAQSHLPFLGVFRGEFAEFLASLFGEWWHVNSDDLAVVVGGEAELTHGDGLFDPCKRADVERLDLNRL